MIVALVPVSRFTVRYEVAQGSPYSELERLVLRAVNEGASSINDLVSIFSIHPRLLIESLVTLTRAGWMALAGFQSKQFVLTPAGKEAAQKGEIPESVVFSSRRTTVLLERLTGGVIPEGEARYVPRKLLERKGMWEDCVRFQTEITDNKIDEGQVQHLLPRRQGQRLHWVGPIEMVSKGAHYIPVGVDIANGTTVNIPERCARNLKPYILDSVREALLRDRTHSSLSWETLSEVVKVGIGHSLNEQDDYFLPPNAWTIPSGTVGEDLLLSSEAHAELLLKALFEASSSVFIACSQITAERLHETRSAFEEALRRGVDIDLMWGVSCEGEAFASVEALIHSPDRPETGGRLRINRSPALSNVKILLWNTADGLYHGVVSSFDWLGEVSEPSERRRDICLGIKLWHSGILSFLSRFGASLWGNTRSESLSSVPDKWRRIAADLETTVNKASNGSDRGFEDNGNAKIRLIVDGEHVGLFREWCMTHQDRLIIMAGTDTTSQKGLQTPRGCNPSYTVLFNNSSTDFSVFSSLKQSIESTGGVLRNVPEMRGNAIISDNSICVSSCNFLHCLSSRDVRMREMGVTIEGADAADILVSHLMQMSCI